MGSFRFRKQIKILPGLTLNLNKQSVSLTAGVRGAHYTLNSKGYRTASVGLPGTGLSYRDTRRVGVKKPMAVKPQPAPEPILPDESWKELWHSEVNGTELLLLTNITPDLPPNFFLYADDGTGPVWVGSYTDALAATTDRRQWEAYLRNGGTVAAWLDGQS